MRLTLLYVDDLSDIGQEFVKKIIQKGHQQELSSTKDLKTPTFDSFCNKHALFFGDEAGPEKKVIAPRRRDSSQVQVDGVVRRRGSLLDALYKSPDFQEIYEAGLKSEDETSSMSMIRQLRGQQ